MNLLWGERRAFSEVNWIPQLTRRYGEVRDLPGAEITETDNPFGIVRSLHSKLQRHARGGSFGLMRIKVFLVNG